MDLKILLTNKFMNLIEHTIIKKTGQRYSIYEYCRGIWRSDDLVYVFLTNDHLVALNHQIIHSGSNVYGFQYKEDSIPGMFASAKMSITKRDFSVFPLVETYKTY